MRRQAAFFLSFCAIRVAKKNRSPLATIHDKSFLTAKQKYRSRLTTKTAIKIKVKTCFCDE